jgi:hypothetical protein
LKFLQALWYRRIEGENILLLILSIDIQFYCFRRLPFFLVYQIGIDLSGGDIFMREHFADRVNFAAA